MEQIPSATGHKRNYSVEGNNFEMAEDSKRNKTAHHSTTQKSYKGKTIKRMDISTDMTTDSHNTYDFRKVPQSFKSLKTNYDSEKRKTC